MSLADVDAVMAQLGLAEGAESSGSEPAAVGEAGVDNLMNQLGLADGGGSGVTGGGQNMDQETSLVVDSMLAQLGLEPGNDGATVAPSSATTKPASPSPALSHGPGAVSTGPGLGGVMSSGPGLGRGRGGVSCGPGIKPSAGPGRAAVPPAATVSSGPGARTAPPPQAGQRVIQKGPSCTTCQQQIIGQLFQACGKSYHPECFVCTQCNRRIFEDEEFVEDENGNPYCEEDYNSLFGEKCAACNQPVTDECIRYRDLVYHINHFTCTSCGTPLKQNPYKEDDDHPFCLVCYENRKKIQNTKGEICAICKRPIMGEFIVLNGQKIHPEHFRCAECGAEFLGGNCHEWEGKNYCKECFDKLIKAVCSKCERPITGRSVTAMARVWHPECFCCTVCNEPFQSASYFEHEGQPYCQFHFYKLHGKACAKCQEVVMGEGINFKDKVYHECCWVCTGCNVALKKHVYDYENKPLCSKCFNKLPKPVRKQIEAKLKAEKKAMKGK